MKLFLLLLFFGLSAHAQDARLQRVEAFFRETGKQVILLIGPRYSSLLSTLSEARISVVPGPLYDNGGSLVDAIGVPGQVTLSAEKWLRFLREDRDVRLLVLHEVLRMARINDDNYVVSRTLLPKPLEGSHQRPYCDLEVATTALARESMSVNAEGFALPLYSNVIMMGVNSADNSMSTARTAAEEDLREKCRQAGYTENMTVLSGMASYVQKNVNGSRRQVFKVELAGSCERVSTVRRDKSLVVREACSKVRACLDLMSTGAIAALLPEDQGSLDEMQRHWSCR